MDAKQRDVGAYAFRSVDSVFPAYAATRALYAGWTTLEVIEVTTRRYTDFVLEHDVDLTLAGIPDAPVTTVRIHSRLDPLTGEVLLDAQRVIGRMAADAQVATPCDEAIDDDARRLLESHPLLLERAEYEWCTRWAA